MSSESHYRNHPRRRFSRELKREVVELLREEAATVAEVAREYDLHPNQLFRWRTEYQRGAYGPASHVVKHEPALLPVALIDVGQTIEAVRPAVELEKPCDPEPIKRLRRLRIVLPKGQMHLEDVDRETLGLLIEALR